jgi:drug/metabolite transporter (DMT)-like permease
MMWVAYSLTAALGAASVSLVLKRAVEHGGVLVSTVVFRLIAGLILLAVVLVSGASPEFTPTFWWATAAVIPPEIVGMVCLSLALRAGELSLVQPLMGLIPLVVTVGGALLLGEVPTPHAAVGVVLVTVGVYCVGLRGRGSVLEPLRALTRSSASWYAMGAVVAWSITTLLHKVGIDEVGPFPWAVTLTLGSAVVLAASLPVLRWKRGTFGLPARTGPWPALIVLAGVLFALQQSGLHMALQATQAGYVVAVTATSILFATAFGVVLLRERAAARTRVAGALLVSSGAVLIALFG